MKPACEVGIDLNGALQEDRVEVAFENTLGDEAVALLDSRLDFQPKIAPVLRCRQHHLLPPCIAGVREQTEPEPAAVLCKDSVRTRRPTRCREQGFRCGWVVLVGWYVGVVGPGVWQDVARGRERRSLHHTFDQGAGVKPIGKRLANADVLKERVLELET